MLWIKGTTLQPTHNHTTPPHPTHPPPPIHTRTNTNIHSRTQRKRDDSLEGTILTHLEPTYRQTDRKIFGSTHEPPKKVCDEIQISTHTKEFQYH